MAHEEEPWAVLLETLRKLIGSVDINLVNMSYYNDANRLRKSRYIRPLAFMYLGNGVECENFSNR